MIRLGRLLGVLAIAVALVGTGCTGGTTGPGVARAGSTPSASFSGQTGPLAFSACMRSHGIANFPDPGGRLPVGTDTLSPQYQAAGKSCQPLLPAGTGGGASAAEEEAGLQYSACMRSHGVPSFPDPIVGHGFQFNLPTGMDPNSPQFQAAQRACASWLPQHGKGMRRGPAESP